MRVAITGSSGLVGRAVRRELEPKGYAVTRVVRDPDAARASDAVLWDPRGGTIDAAGLEGHDAVVHLAGESLIGYWTEAKKARIERSRVDGTRLLASTLAGLDRKPDVLVCASAVGYYGDRAEPADETTGPGTGFLSRVAVAWERAAEPAAAAGIRVVNARFAVILSPRGGVLGIMAPIFKLGIGGSLGSGDQPFPWIALDDVAGGIHHAIETQALEGPVNFGAPEQVTMDGFVSAVGEVLHRPTLFNVPAPFVRLATGDMADEMLLGGAPVTPRRLTESGYTFRHPALKQALEAVLRST